MAVQASGRASEADMPSRLSVVPDRGSTEPLGCFCFAGSGDGAGDLVTDHLRLGGDLDTECWQTGSPVTRGASDGIDWSSSDGLLLMSMAIDNSGDDDPADVSRSCYRRLVDFARAAGYPWLLRLWNHIPQINRGDGDHERYRRFCLGRNLALEEAGIAQSDLCAGTAVGTHGRRLLIHVLAGRRRGVPVENPRQVAAYRYPRIYGPRTPSFARAMALELAGGDRALFVSGTASIVGHRTCHAGHLMRQLDETLLNLDALLGEAAGRCDRRALAGFNADSLVRVYLRDRDAWPAVEQRLREAWPDTPLVGLEADICRRDLLVEIEAFHRG